MTVSTSDNREEYVGNGSTTVFGYAFKIFAATDLEVYLVENGTQTLQTLNTDYTVSGVGEESGGNVTMTTAPTSSQDLVILRVIAVTQETDLRNQGAYFPETLEDEFDRSRMIDQQQQDELNRSLKKPEGGDHFDADGQRIVNMGSAVDPSDAMTRQDVIDYTQGLESGEIADTAVVNTSTGEQTLIEALEDRTPVFATLQALKDSPHVKTGLVVRVVGRNSLFDGGGNLYEIVAAGTGADDGGSFVDLPGSGLQAKGVFPAGINVKQFGAVGDNTTDDSTAFNNALIYSSSGNGGVVHISKGGRYKITSTVSIPSNVTLRGIGKQTASRISAVDDSFVAVSLDGTGACLRDVFVSFDSAVGNNYAIEITANRCDLSRVKVFGVGNGVKLAAGISILHDVEITGFTVSSGVGFLIDAPSTTAETAEIRNLFVEGNATYRPAAAMRLRQAAGIQIVDSDLMQCTRGLHIVSDSALSRGVSSIKAVNTYFDNNTNAQVEFQGDNTNRVEFSSCWYASGQYGILVNGSTDPAIVRGLNIVGGEFYDNSNQGLLVAAGASVTDFQLTGPKFAGNAEDARIQSKTNFIISGAHTGAVGGFAASATGFVIEATCSDYTLVGNRFHDITDNGSSKKRGYNTGLVTENSGSASFTPTVNGTFDIPHGLVDIPTFAVISLIGDSANEAVVQGLDNTNIIGRIRDTTTNGDVTSGTYTVRWFAMIN